MIVAMPRMAVADRRSMLVEAAVRVAAREGVAGTTTRKVVAEAAAPLGAFHYCFRSKQELLREVTTALVEELVQSATEGLQPGADVATSLHDGLRGLWAAVERSPDRQLVTYELTQHALRTSGLEDLARWQYECYWAAAGGFLETVAASAGARWTLPVAVLSRMVVTITDGVVLGWLVDRDTTAALACLEAFAGRLATLAE
jgi:AcrR family transcriptional regulator